MATTVTKVGRGPFAVGPYKFAICDVAFSGSYAAGGEAITAQKVGMRTIYQVHGTVTEASGATAGLPVRWDQANGKLQMYEAAAAGSPGAEKGAEAYATATAGRLTFIGI